jgi:hypothetical protein
MDVKIDVVGIYPEIYMSNTPEHIYAEHPEMAVSM